MLDSGWKGSAINQQVQEERATEFDVIRNRLQLHLVAEKEAEARRLAFRDVITPNMQLIVVSTAVFPRQEHPTRPVHPIKPVPTLLPTRANATGNAPPPPPPPPPPPTASKFCSTAAQSSVRVDSIFPLPLATPFEADNSKARTVRDLTASLEKRVGTEGTVTVLQ